MLYVKRSDLSYTINYYKDSVEEGNRLNEEPSVVNNVTFGETITLNRTQLNAEKPVGYQDGVQQGTLVIAESGNSIDVLYAKRNDLGYVVKYYTDSVETENYINGADVPHSNITFGTTFAELDVELEIAEDKCPDGYVPVGTVNEASSLKTITAETNEIHVVLAKRKDLEYEVNYLESVTNNKLAKQKTVDGQTFKVEVTEDAIDIPGYNKENPVSATITIGTDRTKNVINFYYTKRNDLTYTVNYLDSNDTSKKLADSKTVRNQIFEAQVTENAVIIPGYTVDENSKNLTLGVNGNVINFYYTEDADVIINYVSANTAWGTVTSASETLPPATGVAQGSQAVPQSGYRFDRWVNAAGETVSTSEAFTPNKVNGINVAATYTAHFARRGDLQYEVHYFYEDPTNSSRYLENEALRRNETQATFDDPIPYSTSETEFVINRETRTYTFEKVEGASKVSVNARDNVLNVYYVLDEHGETDPDDPEKDNPNRSDGIPDKYQITFYYSAAENGSLDSDVPHSEVKTIRQIRRDPTTNAIVEVGEVTPAWPSRQPDALPISKYYLLKWHDDTNDQDLSRDVTKWSETWKKEGYTADTYFTAIFEANPDNSWTVEKKVTNIPSRGYFRVGEEAQFDITVRNTGNRVLKEVRVREKLDGAVIVASGSRYTVDPATGEAVIENLALDETVVVKAVYVVTRNDLFNRSFINEVTTEGTILNPEEPNVVDLEEIPANSGSVPAGAQGGGSGSSGGGGGGGSSTRSPGTGGGTAGGPGAPTVTIDPEAVPLANLPDMGNDDILALIDDEEVPLAALPKTGQTGSAALMLMISSMMLAAFAVVTRKKEEEQ